MRSASSARWDAADVIQTLCPHGGSAFKPRALSTRVGSALSRCSFYGSLTIFTDFGAPKYP